MAWFEALRPRLALFQRARTAADLAGAYHAQARRVWPDTCGTSLTLRGLRAAVGGGGAGLDAFVADRLPRIVALAARAAELSDVPLLEAPGVVALARAHVAALVALMFLAVVPEDHLRHRADAATAVEHAAFLRLVEGGEQQHAAKLACFLQYLDVATAAFVGGGASGSNSSSASSSTGAAEAAGLLLLEGTLYLRRVRVAGPPPSAPRGIERYFSVADVSSSSDSSAASPAAAAAGGVMACPDFAGSAVPLLPPTLTTEGGIESHTGRGDTLLTDFANHHVGGGILGSGSVQEEVMFMRNPELVVAKLLCPVMGDAEALVLTGARHLCWVTGYGSHGPSAVRFAGPARPDPTPTMGARLRELGGSDGGGSSSSATSEPSSSLSSSASSALACGGALLPPDAAFSPDARTLAKCVVAIDARYFQPGTPLMTQLQPEHVGRDLVKAYAGFSAAGPECSAAMFPRVATGHWG